MILNVFLIRIEVLSMVLFILWAINPSLHYNTFFHQHESKCKYIIDSE